MIEQEVLLQAYITDRKSMQEIAGELDCSLHKVTYYMDKYAIKRRSIGEAIYQKTTRTAIPSR